MMLTFFDFSAAKRDCLSAKSAARADPQAAKFDRKDIPPTSTPARLAGDGSCGAGTYLSNCLVPQPTQRFLC
jgi:hypothetical protein